MWAYRKGLLRSGGEPGTQEPQREGERIGIKGTRKDELWGGGLRATVYLIKTGDSRGWCLELLVYKIF